MYLIYNVVVNAPPGVRASRQMSPPSRKLPLVVVSMPEVYASGKQGIDLALYFAYNSIQPLTDCFLNITQFVSSDPALTHMGYPQKLPLRDG